MSVLTLRIEPKTRETFYSFVGRLAAVDGVSLEAFLSDFGLPSTGFFAVHGHVVDAIARLANLSFAQVEELVSWTGQLQGKVRMDYRGERIVSRAIRNPEVRGCPDCLRQDADGTSVPVAVMAMRGHWLPRHSRVCLMHGKLLVPLWTVTRPAARDNIQARLAEMRSSILDGTITGSVVTPSAFDTWLDRRLETMTDPTWLGQHPLNVVATMCELVGHIIAGGEGGAGREEKALDLHRVYAAGFDCMIRGQDALDSLFDQRLADRAPTDGPQKVFHPLYRKLGETLLYDQGFDHFRDMLRERICDNWPIGLGEKVLGAEVRERRLHSIASLSQITATDPGTLRRRLAAKGVIDPGDDRPDAQITFPAAAYDRLSTNILDLVFLADVREAMGATEAQFDWLVAAGLITPRISGADLRRVWALDDGLALLKKLQRPATSITPGAAGWMHIEAARQFRAPLSDIFVAVAEGRVPVGTVSGIEGYGSVHVRTAEMAALFRNPQHVGLAPSTFGVSVGVKTGGAIQSLIDQGYMTVTDVPDPRHGRRASTDCGCRLRELSRAIPDLAHGSGRDGHLFAQAAKPRPCPQHYPVRYATRTHRGRIPQAGNVNFDPRGPRGGRLVTLKNKPKT